MILDAIIGVIASSFAALAGAMAGIVAPVINLILTGVEAIVSLFVSGFTLGRLKRKAESKEYVFTGMILLGTMLTVCLILVFGPDVTRRKITLVAEDGHGLPFAALVVRTRSGETHLRTDNAGNARIPRFGVESVTLKDPRYVQKVWEKPEIGRQLIASRTILGSGLDKIAERLLRPATK
jgi:hypothetical protein